MRILLLPLLLLLLTGTACAQVLNNTEWVRISATRRDGSRILNDHRATAAPMNLHFSGDSIYTSANHQYSLAQPYRLEGRKLTVGGRPLYEVDSLSEMLLLLSEAPRAGQTNDDELNTYVFLSSDYLFDYAKQEGNLRLQGDTLISCNNQFSPTLKWNFSNAFNDIYFLGQKIRTLVGSLILSPEGGLVRVNLDPTKDFTEKELADVDFALRRTSGRWVIPPLPRRYQLEVDFELRVLSVGPRLNEISVTFNEGYNAPVPRFSPEQRLAAQQHFRKGLEAYKKKDWEKAADAFVECIDIDDQHLEALYNLAVVYLKLDRKEQACTTWKKLKDLGQKRAEQLLAEYCK